MTDGNEEQEPRNKVPQPRPQARGVRGLLAWQRADELASAIYRTMTASPTDDRWLSRQAIRSAISVPANIAEGYGRGSIGDYMRFVDIARGSLAELEYYLHFFEREHLLDSTKAKRLQDLHQETGRLTHGLWKSLKEKARNGSWDHTGLVREERANYGAEPHAFDEEQE